MKFSLILLSVICTALNVSFYNVASTYQSIEPTFRDVVKLRRPNQWVGLERVFNPDHVAAPILIYPNVISQVNQEDSDRAYGDDPNKYAELHALIPPVDRQFKVTPEVLEFIYVVVAGGYN